MTVTATRDDLLVFVEPDGAVFVFPAARTPEVVEILTTPATVRVSQRTDVAISDEVRQLQPGDDGHARASLVAAGFDVS